MNDQQGGLDIEPEEESVQGEIADAALAQLARTADAVLPLERVLGGGFPLETLLSFLPDPKLKARADAAAALALAVVVRDAPGIAAADAALVAVRDAIAPIKDGFKDPCDLANQLHKRLTGLRADFLRDAEGAVDVLGRRIYAEHRRLEAVAAEARRVAQAEADRLERERVARVAEQAAAQQAPAAVVEALQERAKTATAAPVVVDQALVPEHSLPVAKWKARLVGTPDGDEPHPKVREMVPAQVTQLALLVRAVAEGRAPAMLLEVNWAMADKRASASGSAFSIPGLEAFDAGNVRAKRGR